MMKWHVGFQSLLLLMAVHVLVSKQASFSSEEEKQITSAVETFLKCHGIHGLTLAVVRGKETLTRGFGFADVANRVPVSRNETLFCVASLTKAFTSTLVAILLPGSTTRPNHRSAPTVASILGDKHDCCRLPDSYSTSHVTMTDLLSHRTGLARYDFLWIKGDLSRGEIVRKVRHMDNVFEFRDSPSYSNILYTMAGHVLEQTTGASWEDLVTTHILRPLGMDESTFIGLPAPQGRHFATQYESHYGKDYIIPRKLHSGAAQIGPAISLCTTADDMAKWIKFHINGGKNEQGDQVIPEDEFQQLHDPVVIARHLYRLRLDSPPYPARLALDMYGKGWFIGHYQDLEIVMHYGSFPGFYSMLTLVPSENLGIFTSINDAKSFVPWEELQVLHMYLIDIILDREMWLNASTLCTFPLPWYAPEDQSDQPEDVSENKTLSRPAAVYLGAYQHPVLGSLEVKRSSSGSKLEMRLGRIVYDLLPVGQDRFLRHLRQPEWLVGPGAVSFTVLHESDLAERMTLYDIELDSSPVFTRIHNNTSNIGSRQFHLKADFPVYVSVIVLGFFIYVSAGRI